MAIPSKAEFLLNMDIIANCDICQLPFDGDRIPVRTPCSHIWCKPCLEKWIESGCAQAHTCPMCRTVLFRKTLRIPTFVCSTSGQISLYNKKAWKHLLRSPEHVIALVTELWNQATLLIGDIMVLDAELENCVLNALWSLPEHLRDFRNVPFVHSKQWPALRHVVRLMIITQCEDADIVEAIENGAETVPLREEELLADWWPKFGAAVGWNVEDWTYTEPGSALNETY